MNINNRKLIISIGIGVLVGGVLAVALGFFRMAVHGKYPQGTVVAGIDLSYLSRDSAERLLEKAKENYLSKPLKVSVMGSTKAFSPRELGVNVLVDETLGTLKELDAREFGLAVLIKAQIVEPEKKEPVVTVDTEMLDKKIRESFNLAELAPKSASFYFDEKGGLAIKEGKDGVVAETESLVPQLKNASASFSTTGIVVSSRKESHLVSAAMLEKQRQSIEEALNFKFTLLDPVYSDNWDLSLSGHLDWVRFVQKQRLKIPYTNKEEVISDPLAGSGTGYYVAIEIDQDKLNAFVDEKLAKWLDRPAEDVHIYKDDNGKIQIEGKGGDGKKIQRKFLKEAIELGVENRIKDITVPVINLKPVTNISQELLDIGIKERISVGHTSYYGSPANRLHNIKIGASRFNGLLLAPGSEFSFNKNLGKVDGSTGYKKELVIKKEGTIPEFGGGICQVSTTMYRAALFAGVPITERNEHSYAVSYYSQILGHGLDATIYLGGADLKFKNDTGHDLLIQTYIEKDYELYIVFYGTADGRKVEMEGPYLSGYHSPGPTVYEESPDLSPGQTKQVEKAHTGFKALWYRILTLADGTIKKESITTNYRAVPGKVKVGKATTP